MYVSTTEKLPTPTKTMEKLTGDGMLVDDNVRPWYAVDT